MTTIKSMKFLLNKLGKKTPLLI